MFVIAFAGTNERAYYREVVFLLLFIQTNERQQRNNKLSFFLSFGLTYFQQYCNVYRKEKVMDDDMLCVVFFKVLIAADSLVVENDSQYLK